MNKPNISDELKAEWMRIDRALIPNNLLGSMPQPECKGLTLLTDVMINATVCKLGPRIGQITATYSKDIKLTLDVASTIMTRLKQLRKHDLHLSLVIRSSETHAESTVCIVDESNLPGIDACVSFVLWAESGFPNPPLQLIDRIEYVRDPVHYEEKMKAQQEERERVLRIRNLERQLANEKLAERLKVEETYQLERRRLQELGWRALISEHESTVPDGSTNAGRLYHLRDHLLSPPAPGEKIGQPKNAETRNWRNRI